MSIPTAEEFLIIFPDTESGFKLSDIEVKLYSKKMIEFAKLHVQEALKEASEIADDWENSGELAPEILNAYSLENIK